MKEKIIVSTSTLFSSLACYFYARDLGKDAVPYVMIGGFLGAVVGETIVYMTTKDKNDNPPGAANA